MTNTDATEQAAMAQIYALSGLAIFPLWWTAENGRCACPRGRLPELHNNYCGRTRGGDVKGSPGKHPMTKTGVKAATVDRTQITDWWQRAPLANIGLAAGSNGLAVIDVDPKHGGEQSLNRLTSFAAGRGVDLLDTMSARTGSGGLHLFYAAPVGVHSGKCVTDNMAGPNGCAGCIRNGQGNKPPFGVDMPGLDTRGYGGYLVAPPSTHVSGGAYEWIDFVKDPRNRGRRYSLPSSRPHTGPQTGRSGASSRPGTSAGTPRPPSNREIEQLRSTGEGGRNAQLNVAAFNLGQLVGAGALARGHVEQELAAAASLIGLTDAETRATIRSGINKGITQPRTIPRAGGRRMTIAARDFRALVAVAEGEDPAEVEERTRRQERVAKLRALLVDTDGLENIPEPDPLVPGVLYRDSLAWLYGEPGCGKSFVAVDVAGCVGTGQVWQGYGPAVKGDVIYLVAEGVTGIKQRVRAWEALHEPADDRHVLSCPSRCRPATPASGRRSSTWSPR
jgi:hypothetical protein